MANHHPHPELLMDYASGALHEGPALAVATHLALCGTCRKEVSAFESAGGNMLERGCEAIAVSDKCKAAVMAALDAPAPENKAQADTLCSILPAPLRSYVGCSSSQINWQRVNAAVEKLPLVSCCKGNARLLKVKAGTKMPKHTHKGSELTLVLQGSMRDGEKLYRRGDFCACDGSITHQPVAGEGEDCLCLVVSHSRMRLRGFVGRILSPFVRI